MDIESDVFLVIDTNIWLTEAGLQSEHGAAVRFFARQRKLTVVIPEIVKLEVEELLVREMISWRSKAKDNHSKLRSLFGSLHSARLPSDDDIRKVAKNVTLEIDIPTRQVTPNIDAFRSAMSRVIRKITPCKKSEEFRDSLIWWHCLELLSEGDVYLVTKDSDFYEQSKVDSGELASELVEEVKEKSERHNLVLLPSLSHLMKKIKVPFVVRKKEIFGKIYESYEEIILSLLFDHGFVIEDDNIEGELKCYATEKSEIIFFSCYLEKSCSDIGPTDRQPCKLKVRAQGYLSASSKELSDLRVSSIILDFTNYQQEDGVRGHQYL